MSPCWRLQDDIDALVGMGSTGAAALAPYDFTLCISNARRILVNQRENRRRAVLLVVNAP